MKTPNPMPCRRLMSLFALILHAACACAAGDLIVFANGDRLQGRVLSEGESGLELEIIDADTGIRYVRRVPRSHVVRIEPDPEASVRKGERGDDASAFEVESASGKSGIEATGDHGRARGPQKLTKEERVDLIASAMELRQKEAYSAAALGLTKLISNTPRGDLDALSRDLESQLGVSLPDLVSDTRLRAARASSGNGTFRLRHVTRYEREALVERLRVIYGQVITTPVSRSPAASTNLPSGAAAGGSPRAGATSTGVSGKGAVATDGADRPGVYTIAEYLDAQPRVSSARSTRRRLNPKPTEAEGHLGHLIQRLGGAHDPEKIEPQPITFDGSPEDAAYFARVVREAESLLSERLRYDASLRKDPSVMNEVRRHLSVLHRLLDAVEARAGGAKTSEEREQIEFQKWRALNAYRNQLERESELQKERYARLLEETGAEPGTTRVQAARVEGAVMTESTPDGIEQRLEARMKPLMPPGLLQEATLPDDASAATATRPASLDEEPSP